MPPPNALGWQVARTSHFNTTQQLVNSNGEGAATFFLATKHRHMPNSQVSGGSPLPRPFAAPGLVPCPRAPLLGFACLTGPCGGVARFWRAQVEKPVESKIKRRRRLKLAKANGSIGDDDGGGSSAGASGPGGDDDEDEEGGGGGAGPKKRLVAELGACGVKDPVHTALVLFNGHQCTWGDVSWAFASEGVEGGA